MSVTAPAWSLNLTDPARTRQLTDAECSTFSAPLFITGALICAEVVFWSPRWSSWIVLVRDRTGRPFPEGAREVASGELEQYERVLLGMG